MLETFVTIQLYIYIYIYILVLKPYRVTAKLQWSTLFTITQYGDCDQTRFLSSLGSHKFFYRRNKHENNYKVDYQRLKDLSWDTIWVKSINTKYDKIIHFKLHTEYGYFWELFLKWTEFIPKMGIFLERFLVILS